MKRYLLLALPLLSCIASVAMPATGKSTDVALHWMKDPGVAPTLNPADYDAYRHGGTASISGKIVLKSSFHETLCDEPVLYPNTPYTRWLIEEWAFKLDGKQILKSHLLTPSARGMGVPIPDYLDELSLQPAKAVIAGKCTDYRDYSFVSFEHVPAGSYYLVDDISRGIPYTSHDTEDATIAGPFGVAPGYIITPHYGARPGDGYAVASHAPLVVEDGHSYTLAPDAVIPVAHFRGG